MKSTKTVLAVAIVSLLSSASTPADIINVPADQPTIQAGIDAATDGDEVVVAPGTYNELIDFVGKAITLRSSDGADVTTIDGAGLNDSVVKCINGEGPKTMLQDLSVARGLAIVGGGMIINNESGPIVSGCVFIGNMAEQGGAIYASAGTYPVVTECVFRRNLASVGAGIGINGSGDGTFTVSNCVFIENTSTTQGGGIYGEADWTITNCIFARNRSPGRGGAFREVRGSVTISNCVFSENQSGGLGGGLFMTGLDALLAVEQSLFVNNGGRTGGGMYLGGVVSVQDCVIVGNRATDDGGRILITSAPPTIGGSLFCGNMPNDIAGSYDNAGGNQFPKQCPGIGACCMDDDCVVMTQPFCESFKGTYQGDDTACDEGTCSQECPADLDDNGNVDAADLATLLGAWGECPK